MKKLIIIRWLVISLLMFSTGFTTGWWFHQRLYIPVDKPHEDPAPPLWFSMPPPEAWQSDHTVENNLISDFVSALTEQRFDDALVFYQRQERTGNIAVLKRQLLDIVGNWVKDNRSDLAINALERFTQHYYQDRKLLTELAGIYFNDKEYIKSLETLLTVRSFLMAGPDYEKVSGDILDLARLVFQEHSNKQALETSLYLFQKLTMLEPEQGFYRYALVESYLAVNDLNSAISELEILQMDPEYEKKAADMLLALLPPAVDSHEDKQTAGIPLQLAGKHYIATVTLQDNSRVSLLLDTGASLTTLPNELLLNLKRRKMAYRVSHAHISTAGGTVFAPVYQVKELILGNFVLKNLEVAGMNSGLLQVDGLLGMNALRQFHFQIDQDRSQLLLTPR